MKIHPYWIGKIKRAFGIRSPSGEAAKLGRSISYHFNSGMQKQQCKKANSIYQPYEIKGLIETPSYGNIESIVREFEWTKREAEFF